MDTLENKFKHYTLEELNQYIWLWEYCSPIRLLNSKDDYNLAIEEKENRIKEQFEDIKLPTMFID